MIVNDPVGQREVFAWFFRMLPRRLAPNPSASWGESRLSIASLPPHCINVFAPTKEAEKKPHLFFRTGLGADRAWHNCGRCRNFRDRQLQSSTQLPILLAQPFALRKRFSEFRVLEVGCTHIKNCSLLQNSIWRTRKSWSSVNLFFCSLTALSTRNSKATSTGFSPSLRSTSTNHWKSFSPTR